MDEMVREEAIRREGTPMAALPKKSLFKPAPKAPEAMATPEAAEGSTVEQTAQPHWWMA